MGKLRLGTAIGISVVIAVAACSSPYSSSEPTDSPIAEAGVSAEASLASDAASSNRDAATSSLPECKAQRVVHLVGGNGGLAWFTLLWPVPDVITTFDSRYAYDDPKNASLVVSNTHPLYARAVKGETLFEGTGTHPMVTAFVANRNQTHTFTPVATYTQMNVDILGVGAVAQKQALAPKVPVVNVGTKLTYQPIAGGPSALIAATASDAANLVATAGGLPDASKLTPDQAAVALWSSNSTNSYHHDLAQGLFFAAKAFELGLVGTVLMPALEDDPHAAFTGGTAAPYADILVHLLDSFYTELAKFPDPSCSHNGQPISLADNTVLIVSGDTPKNPYVAMGWGDGSPGGGNLLYVRSNGFVTPGWFGNLTAAQTRVNFDPVTGLNSNAATLEQSTDAALGGILYAIVRGDSTMVDLALSNPYSGVLTQATP